VKKKEIKPDQYLILPTTQLLEKFGEGNHIPGSGSASALSGLLAIELMITVCKLTGTKESYRHVKDEISFIQSQLESLHRPRLRELFIKDIEVFDQVSKIRKKRDREKNATIKGLLTRQATEKLKEATDIPIEICRQSLMLTTYAFTIFDKGFKSAQGDSGVALSNLLSAISGSLFVTLLNLKTARKSKWTEELRTTTEVLAKEYQKTHKEAIKRVLNLYSEGLPDELEKGQTKLLLE
jgi:methenyltetrahydrofolate cyclohydrolase